MTNQSGRESQLPTTPLAGFLRGEFQETYGHLAHEEHSHGDERKSEPHPTPKSDCCDPGVPHPTPKSDCCDPGVPHPTPKSDCCEPQPHPYPHQHAPQHASWFSL